MSGACVYLPCDSCGGDGCKVCGFTGKMAIYFRCRQCGGVMEKDMLGWFCPECDGEEDDGA